MAREIERAKRAADVARRAFDTADSIRQGVSAYRDPAAKLRRRRKRARWGLAIRAALAIALGVVTWQVMADGEYVLGAGVGAVAVAGAVAAAGAVRRVWHLEHLPTPTRPPRLPSSRSVAREPMERLSAREQSLGKLLSLLGSAAGDTKAEADVAAVALHTHTERLIAVETALSGGGPSAELDETVRRLAARLEEGVAAYERLVSATAEAVAAMGDGTPDPLAMQRLGDATDRLSGLAAGLREIEGSR